MVASSVAAAAVASDGLFRGASWTTMITIVRCSKLDAGHSCTRSLPRCSSAVRRKEPALEASSISPNLSPTENQNLELAQDLSRGPV